MNKLFCYFLFFFAFSGKALAQESAVVTIKQDLQYFEDNLATSLKKSFKASDLAKLKDLSLRKVAAGLLDGSYTLKYRSEDFKARLSPDVLGKKLSIGNGYSQYENATGIYLSKGKHTILVRGIGKRENIELWVPNWNRRAPEGISPTKDPKGWGIEKKRFKLRDGINIIELNDFDGLAYVNFYSENPEQEGPVSLHFIDGQVNGYFDAQSQNDNDWNNLLDNAVYPIVDAFGKHLQIVYPVEDCKKHAYGRGKELMDNYDRLVLAQYRIIGLEKYNRIPESRILSRVNYNYYMFRDADGVAYMGTEPGYALNRLIDPDLLLTSGACWGFSHEVGHVHQLRNYFNWAGMGEVSNNVMTMYATTTVGQTSNLANRKHYQKAHDSIINQGISYLQDSDFMNRLVPFWQLHLYFNTQGNNPDFYPDLFEAFRIQSMEGAISNPDRNPAIYQLNFVKKACEISKVDLTDFFEKYGFFKIGDFHVRDYSSAQYVMTSEMVKECKNYISSLRLAKPSMDISMIKD